MVSIEQKKYPIGNFGYGKTYSAKEVKALIDDIDKLPKQLKKALKKLKGDQLDTPYRPGGWTARQVVHHIADSHVNAYIRMKLAATENTPSAKTYAEGLWAELPDGKTGSVKLSVKLLTALHNRWVSFLKNLSAADMSRGYFSPGAGRVINIDEAIALYSWHGRHHVGHIRLLSGWEPSVVVSEPDDTPAPELATLKTPAKRGRKPKAAVVAPTAAETQPARRGRKPKQQAEAAPQAEPVAEAKPKRVRRTKEQIAADNAAKAAMPKLSQNEILAKARAAAAANRLAAGKSSPEAKPKRGPKPKAASSAPKMSRHEVMAKARAAAAANRAARKAEMENEASAQKSIRRPKAAAAPAAAPKRARRTKEQIAADLATKAAAKAAAKESKAAAKAAAKAAKPPVDRREQMAKARAAAAANRAARGIVPKEKKPVSDGPKMSTADALAKGRATLAAKRAAEREAKGLPPVAPKKPVSDGPKMSREEVLAKMHAARAAKIAERKAAAKQTLAPPVEGAKKRGMSAEHMAKIRAMRTKKN